MTVTISELDHRFSELMQVALGKETGATGFTIGNGKKLYWYITPTRNGNYRCIALGESPRYVNKEQLVTIHYKSKKH